MCAGCHGNVTPREHKLIRDPGALSRAWGARPVGPPRLPPQAQPRFPVRAAFLFPWVPLPLRGELHTWRTAAPPHPSPRSLRTPLPTARSSSPRRLDSPAPLPGRSLIIHRKRHPRSPWVPLTFCAPSGCPVPLVGPVSCASGPEGLSSRGAPPKVAFRGYSTRHCPG